MDMHEAMAPEEVLDPRDGKTYPGGSLSYSLVTHPKYLDYAIEMLMELEERGGHMKAEQLVPGFYGVSHYEFGEGSGCVPFLSETLNPAQNPHRVGGEPLYDRCYPIEERVGIGVEVLRLWLGMCREITGCQLMIWRLPRRLQIIEEGLGAWLH